VQRIGLQQAIRAEGNSYALTEHWAQLPADRTMGATSWVDVDSKGIVYVFRRCEAGCTHPEDNDPPGRILRFDPTGKFLGEWGAAIKPKEAHGLRVDANGFVWTTDTLGHQVKKTRPDGTVVLTLGRYGVPGDGPDTFNQPTDVAVGSNGDIFVTDGYGNQRVVKFNAAGKFIKAWGTKGTAPGQFRLPHTIVQDSRGRLIVGDRCGLGATGCTDNRIQIFDTNGTFIDQWTHLGAQALYITKDDKLYVSGNGRISIADAKTGKVLETVEKAGGHGIAVDRAGNIYTASPGNGAFQRYSRR